jgi:hypothetical protein
VARLRVEVGAGELSGTAGDIGQCRADIVAKHGRLALVPPGRPDRVAVE